MVLSRVTKRKRTMNLNDLPLTQVDTLGNLLAQIKELEDKADAIKNTIKEAGADGLLPVDAKGIRHLEGNLFRATYIETNRSGFDKDAFIKEYGADTYAKFTKTSAVFTVKVTAR